MTQTPILILAFAITLSWAMAVLLVGWWLMRRVSRKTEIETRV
jgi:hypothetical protein